jgi:HAD superfamily hydrolase (TIGR01509 family)
VGSASLLRPSRPSEGVASPFAEGERIRAVLFDLDGTLYRQKPMRALMAVELLTLAVRNPIAAPRRWRALSEYRKTQETLRKRNTTAADADMSRDQIGLAAARAGISREELEILVDEWMLNRPLKYLPWCRVRGLIPLLDFFDRLHLKIGVLSDYPPAAKLRALGLASRFSLVLCSTDQEIGAFKPHPRGFLVACDRWGLTPREVLMVGDRADVDAAGAAAAGMPCVVIGKQSSRNGADVLVLESLERLRRVLDDGR